MKKVRVYDIFFYIFYTLLILYHGFSRVYFFMPIRNSIKYVVVAGLIFTFGLQSKKYKIKSFFILVIVLLLFFASYLISNDMLLFITAFFVIASKNLDFKKFIKYDFYLKIAVIGLVILLYKLGLTEVVTKLRADGTVRNAMGFGHPNILGAFLFSICLDLVYVYYKKYRLIHYVIMIGIFLINYYVTDSRTTQILIVLLFVFMHFSKIENKSLLRLIKLLPIILFTISLLSAIFYDYKIDMWRIANKLTSSRIKSAHEFLDYYGINLLGHYFEFYGQWEDPNSKLIVLDNAYVHVLLKFGLINTLIIGLSLVKTTKLLIKEKNTILLLCFSVMLLSGLMELYVYQIAYMPMFLYIGKILYYEENKNERKN